MHMQNSVNEAPNLLHWHLPLHFSLQPQVTVYISGSAAIYLLGINTEPTEFQSNSKGFILVSGADSSGRISKEDHPPLVFEQ